MRRDWLKLIGGVALATALAGGTTVYAEENDFAGWDTDTSGDISSEEWDTGFDDEGVYSEWDSDGDGSLTEDEYGEGIYGGYDEDGDGALNEEEFGAYQEDEEEGLWSI